ncbi:MAG: hypothetical protein E7Z62_04175 [Thermoplasmata archaeon]|nr:hypothetical protein [Thermoplasmata archaeon]MBR4244665.1 hypothetical protein [Candidatus Methanomethylophilaceae archaeon]
MSEFKPLDPTACGLFLVAAISLPLAVSCFDSKFSVPAELFLLLGALITVVALLAYRAESNFGFTVFLLVGAAVFASGYGIGIIGNLAFGIIFVMCIIWSILAKTPKNLTLILCTTAAIFLVIAIEGICDVDLATVLGIVSLLNFVLTFYMASALASEGKFPVF